MKLGRSIAVAAACVSVLAAGPAAGAPSSSAAGGGARGGVEEQPWRNASLSPDTRARLLAQAMTLDQKILLFAPDPGTPIPELGVPPRRDADGCCGLNAPTPTTALPKGLSLASTFSEHLGFQFGDVAGTEAWLNGQTAITTPTLDLCRTPFNGRQWESFGEDPLLMGRFGIATVQEVQINPV